MNNTLLKTLFLAAVLALTSQAQAAGVGTNISVRLVGSAVGYDGTGLWDVYGLPQPSEAPACFDLDLVDVKTGAVIGGATDCLTDINPSGDGLALTGTTFFFLPGGTLISRGLTTVQPVTHGSLDFTHITGAIPQAGDNSIIYGDGKFRKSAAPVRLSGAVNLSKLGSDGEITFDCMFAINLARPK